ncbi:MAG TPA: DUF6541 family protein [bacterium]|nr:DUF6541 family protein [bacterium]
MRKDYLICVLLIAFWAVGNVVWLALDDTPPVWDPAFHILDAIEASQAISRLDVGRLLMLQGEGTFYPPLWHVAAGILMLLFGRSVDVAIAANLLFVPVIVFSIYYAARQLFDRRVGLLATCVGVLLPGLWGWSRTAYIDFALTGMVALFMALILAPDALRKRTTCAALGLVFGLGMLTKWTFIVYVAGPALVVLVTELLGRIKQGKAESRSGCSTRGFLACVLLLSLTAAVVALPWYLLNAKHILARAGGTVSEYREMGPSSGFYTLLGSYLLRLITDQLFVPCFLLALAGALISIRRPKPLAFLLSWALAPLPFLSAIGLADLRYTLPIVPAFAILGGIALQRLMRRRWPRAVVTSIIVLLAAQWVVVSFGVGVHSSVAIEVGGVHLPIWGCIAQEVRPALEAYWPYKEILGHLTQSGVERPSVFVVPVSAEINPWTLMLEARLAGTGNVRVCYRSFDRPAQDHVDALLNSDFILCKDGGQGVSPFASKALVLGGLLLNDIRSSTICASLTKRFPLPDGSSVYVLGPNRISQEAAKALKERFVAEVERLGRPKRPGRFVSPNETSVFSRFPERVRWSPAEESLWYVVRISGAVPTIEVRVCGEQLTVAKMQADLMPPGQYTIEVAAANPKGRSEWLKGEFIVGHF